MDMMNRVCKPYFNKFVIVFIDNILTYSKSEEDHTDHLKILLEVLRTETLYAKFLKCEFWLSEVQFLGHIINADGIQVDPFKIEAISKWETPKSQTEVRSFFGLVDGNEGFSVYCDTSHTGFGCVLMQGSKVIAYAS
ncbi:hypothetical protein L1987_54200 [Smallanthus sonchifolius]|uniref:Uncharacterized protein n=1 Tax=Smallanthus sonchifolius TaxID=185202 RepID=A0ACB9E6K3_9ASTR|nr:hypothetical protein L1987_54200 [Smallanthus sonchifolius]